MEVNYGRKRKIGEGAEQRKQKRLSVHHAMDFRLFSLHSAPNGIFGDSISMRMGYRHGIIHYRICGIGKFHRHVQRSEVLAVFEGDL